MSALTSIGGMFVGIVGAHHLAQAPDDLAGAQAFGADLAHRLADLVEVRLGHVEVTLAGARVGGDRGQRLVDLVRHARPPFRRWWPGAPRASAGPAPACASSARRAWSVTSAPEHSQPAGLPSAARRAMQRQ